ncbi:MAG: hypothetical protein G8237_14755 [Magnetococcales bacterium]|nr:hypothetical protein [Magnetococcales bacterium]
MMLLLAIIKNLFIFVFSGAILNSAIFNGELLNSIQAGYDRWVRYGRVLIECNTHGTQEWPSPNGHWILEKYTVYCDAYNAFDYDVLALRRNGKPRRKSDALYSDDPGMYRHQSPIIAHWLNDTHVIVATDEHDPLKELQTRRDHVQILEAFYSINRDGVKNPELHQNKSLRIVHPSVTFNKGLGVSIPAIGCDLSRFDKNESGEKRLVLRLRAYQHLQDRVHDPKSDEYQDVPLNTAFGFNCPIQK